MKKEHGVAGIADVVVTRSWRIANSVSLPVTLFDFFKFHLFIFICLFDLGGQ